jgi:FtsH-binding integral membrane protein
MSAVTQGGKLSGAGAFLLTLFLITPSVIAFVASTALAHEANFPPSALWLIYSNSLYIGCAGASIAGGLTVFEAMRQQIPQAVIWLMGASVTSSIFFFGTLTMYIEAPGTP